MEKGFHSENASKTQENRIFSQIKQKPKKVSQDPPLTHIKIENQKLYLMESSLHKNENSSEYKMKIFKL